MKIKDDTFNAAESVGQLLKMLAGAASMCWENINAAGVFDTKRALALTNAAEGRLREILDEENNRSKMALAERIDNIINAESEQMVKNLCSKCEMPRDNRHPDLCPICLLEDV